MSTNSSCSNSPLSFFKEAPTSINSIKWGKKATHIKIIWSILLINITLSKLPGCIGYISSNFSISQPRKKSFQFQFWITQSQGSNKEINIWNQGLMFSHHSKKIIISFAWTCYLWNIYNSLITNSLTSSLVPTIISKMSKQESSLFIQSTTISNSNIRCNTWWHVNSNRNKDHLS